MPEVKRREVADSREKFSLGELEDLASSDSTGLGLPESAENLQAIRQTCRAAETAAEERFVCNVFGALFAL